MTITRFYVWPFSLFTSVNECFTINILDITIVSERSNIKKQRTQSNRKYDDSYLEFELVVKFGSENSIPLPQCVICHETMFSDKSIVT